MLAVVFFWTRRFVAERDERRSLLPALAGLILAGATLAVMIGAPVMNGMAGTVSWPNIAVTYFLAAGNRIAGSPYAFFWTPRWMYPVGSLTPLVALGAVIALASGWSAMRSARPAALVIVVVASCLLAFFVAAGVCAAANVWKGIPD